MKIKPISSSQLLFGFDKMQKRLDYSQQPKDPWADICCESCWFAAQEKCVCSCGGRYHGLGKERARANPSHPALPYDIGKKLLEKIPDKELICMFCLDPLPKRFHYYAHEGGWKINYFEKPQWIYIHCSKCGYDWNIGKLGYREEKK